MEYKDMLTGLIKRLSGSRDERLSAGTKYRLMGLVADVTEVVQTLQEQVLQRVSQEAVLDVDDDIDYEKLSEQMLMLEMPDIDGADDVVRKQTELVNKGLALLSETLCQIDNQLERRHKDEEYERLYEQEKRRYMSSGTSRRARQTFDKWQYDVCYGTPSLDDINDYVTEKLLHLFEKGVFNTKVEHIQRAKRYPGEIDFDQLDEDHKLKKNVYKHYAALRKLVDYVDGCLVVNAARVGQYFYAGRKEENAKALRNAFLKYMHKIELAQQERRKLLEKEESQLSPSRSAAIRQDRNEELFHFVHPEIEDEEAWRIHDAIKRLVANYRIPDICVYLKEQKQNGKLMLPSNPSTMYSELVRLGMPKGEGFSEKNFSNSYTK